MACAQQTHRNQHASTTADVATVRHAPRCHRPEHPAQATICLAASVCKNPCTSFVTATHSAQPSAEARPPACPATSLPRIGTAAPARSTGQASTSTHLADGLGIDDGCRVGLSLGRRRRAPPCRCCTLVAAGVQGPPQQLEKRCHSPVSGTSRLGTGFRVSIPWCRAIAWWVRPRVPLTEGFRG